MEKSDCIKAVITLPYLNPLSTFCRDMENFLVKRMPFEGVAKSNLHLMTRQRLVMIWRLITEAIDQSFLI
jgi:hypothetical protein